jgi:hypothetical protein
MKINALVPKDQRSNNWIIRHPTKDGPVRLRAQYADLRCRGCGKVDEEIAIARGLDPSIKIKADDDVVQSSDLYILFSRRLLGILSKHSVSGFKTTAFPTDSRYVLAWPDVFASVDRSLSGIEVHGTCFVCGRARETCFFPRLESMVIPTHRRCLFSPELWTEKSYGKMLSFLTVESVIEILVSERVSGLEYWLLGSID